MRRKLKTPIEMLVTIANLETDSDGDIIIPGKLSAPNDMVKELRNVVAKRVTNNIPDYTQASTDEIHQLLLGVDDQILRFMAPEATHQHYKGGLYRDMGIAMDPETNGSIDADDGEEARAWYHVCPYESQLFIRSTSEDNKFRKLT